MPDDLDYMRNHINQLDEQLVRLLNERARVALEIGKVKASLGVKVYDPAREGVVIQKVNALNQGPLSKGDIESIYREIIDACRQIQLR